MENNLKELEKKYDKLVSDIEKPNDHQIFLLHEMKFMLKMIENSENDFINMYEDFFK